MTQFSLVIGLGWVGEGGVIILSNFIQPQGEANTQGRVRQDEKVTGTDPGASHPMKLYDTVFPSFEFI